MYELIILSYLIRRPFHGYLIAKIINDQIGPYARISNGRFYPLLAKLVEEGYIVEVEEDNELQHGQRHSRSYTITERGRERFRRLMLDTTSNPGEYQKIFLFKAAALRFMQPEERNYLIEHYLNYCHAHLLHLKAEAEDIKQNGPSYDIPSQDMETVLATLQHMSQQWQVEVDWAKDLQERELAAQSRAATQLSRPE